jgi:hypothetical protein
MKLMYNDLMLMDENLIMVLVIIVDEYEIDFVVEVME